jgi:hypothetical protein
MLKSQVYKDYEKNGFIDVKSECCESDVIVEWINHSAYIVCKSCNNKLKMIARKKDRYGCY